MKSFEGRTVLVTGASSGIGRASAQRLAGLGAIVIAVARKKEPLDLAVAELPGSGHLAFVADACVAAQLEPLLAMGKERGGYAGAVLCAGSHTMRPIALLDETNILDVFKQNVTSSLLVTKTVAKAARKDGCSVVWMSSVSAFRGTPGFAAYSAAKAALVAAARVAAMEYASRKIRINTIAAGVVATPMSDAWLSKLSVEQRATVEQSHPLGLGQPEDIAAAACFLLSEDARWITGSTMFVDGGLSAH